jgi:excisionase family DNA binding protein
VILEEYAEREDNVRVGDVAQQLEVSTSTVYALIAAGRLRCSRVGLGRGVIRISDEQLAEYLRAAEQEALPPAPAPRLRLKHLRLS